MHNDPNNKSEQVTRIRSLTAAAGICFVVAFFCVVTPFFLASDTLSALLLLGFFVATFGTFFFARKVYVAEQSMEEAPRGNGAT